MIRVSIWHCSDLSEQNWYPLVTITRPGRPIHVYFRVSTPSLYRLLTAIPIDADATVHYDGIVYRWKEGKGEK